MLVQTIPPDLQRRREDYPLITGHAHYVDDIRLPVDRPPVLHLVFIRSIYGHATIQHIDLARAQAFPGVFAAFTGAELVQNMRELEVIPVKGLQKSPRRPMATSKVRYVGDPVAVVLAEDRYIAQDASELVEVDYEPLPAVTDTEATLADNAPLLYEEFGSNRAFTHTSTHGDITAAFTKADQTVRLRLVNQRLVPSSIEPRGCLFDFDSATGILSAWVSSQSVYRMRDLLIQYLGLDPQHVHVYNADVGGAFGVKNATLGEELIAASLAMKFGRPVKWIEGRSENLQAQAQGRGNISYVEAAFQKDGRLLGLKVRLIAEMGAYLTAVSPMLPVRLTTFLCGPYRVEAVESEVVGVYNNKAPTAPYRGAGRPEAAYIMERVMDRIAHELQLDPVAVRLRNFIAADAFPHKTVTGVVYDSGNYQVALDKALALVGYENWREKQRTRRFQNDKNLLGIGLATFIELSGDTFNPPPGAPKEAATVRIQRDGKVLVQSGTAHNGQGHFTIFAQIAANILQVPASSVEVQMNNSDLPAYSVGTFSSRITQIGASAILLATEAVRDKAFQVAAHLLEAAPSDLVLEQGTIMVRGVPTRSVDFATLARTVEEQPDLVAHDAPNPANNVAIEGLAAWRDFAPTGASYASGTHIAVVEIEGDTGIVEILHYVAVDDCGRVLNHDLTEAQIHGGLAQGIGQALFEEVVYDNEGQLITSTFMDYALPNADQVPMFVTDLVETPSPVNPLGAKGAGEAGCIGAPPAIVNAVLDALSPLGIESIDMPLKPETVWQAIQTAQMKTQEQ